ncbi:DNA-directed RNA polymerase subunit M [Sulfolobus acidocaldarius]|uniref:DNA-directed RNA polymerase subunit M n=4 Tax=Sulfolobus acidocaldarius TaxID=2285 RepID=Q8NKP2_9CREN|nr:DNA-directed RNA polymerase subunit M [Sulfolobus acidocaldarius]AAY80900.1 conserved Archaeal protein, similar to rpoM [Sulfolobus acidocaldarius DSM 639]ALU30268.1 DNA-directed RNA polymerase subunit M [Sulfolobus acidocaldarius]ALU30984.1 DNA-directed RNA polymerase subunit M [Sulfolobus acidocaldarius]WCM35408.1 DNA-directed RNA polymerase subunit M [Sulfolobus acidocaldarius DSM 639]CAD31985.1 hypothetical protein [Sulfolobus acidocaldarius]
MQFCPKCGGLMVPAKKDNKDILRCTKCKFEREMTDKEKKQYSVKENKGKTAKVLTTSLVSDKGEIKLSEDQLAHEREEYYKEVGLDLLREELEESQEEE